MTDEKSTKDGGQSKARVCPTYGQAADRSAADLLTGIERCEAPTEQAKEANRRNHLAATVREPVSDARAA